MITIGIDPGKTGCLCVLEDNTPIFYDWPKDNNMSSYFSYLCDLITPLEVKLAVLEKVHAMPKQGVTSMFNFGVNFGAWQAFLIIHEIPHRIITPQQWMKGLVTKTDGPDTKSAVKNVAMKLFPKVQLHGSKGGYMSGRGDALLMAYYANQQK